MKSIPTRWALPILLSALLRGQTNLDLDGRYWMPQMSATIRVERGGFGTDIDARRDLGIPDTNFPQGAVTLTHGRNVLSFTYTPIDLAGDQMVSRTVVFQGVSYTIGTRVQSDLDVRQLEFRWAFQLLRLADGRVRLGPMFEADGFLLKGSVSAPELSPPVTAQEQLKVGFPLPGIALDIEPRYWIDIYGRVAGMEIGGYGYYVGSDSGVKVRPWRHLALTAGYRTFNLGVDHSPDFARLRLRGPFVGAGVRF